MLAAESKQRKEWKGDSNDVYAQDSMMMIWELMGGVNNTEENSRRTRKKHCEQQVYRRSIQSSRYVPSVGYGIVGKPNKDRQRA